jgi:hypothetical protein
VAELRDANVRRGLNPDDSKGYQDYIASLPNAEAYRAELQKEYEASIKNGSQETMKFLTHRLQQERVLEGRILGISQTGKTAALYGQYHDFSGLKGATRIALSSSMKYYALQVSMDESNLKKLNAKGMQAPYVYFIDTKALTGSATNRAHAEKISAEAAFLGEPGVDAGSGMPDAGSSDITESPKAKGVRPAKPAAQPARHKALRF